MVYYWLNVLKASVIQTLCKFEILPSKDELLNIELLMTINKGIADNLSEIFPAELLVGNNLRELRTRQGFSLRALAESSGLNINTLSMIENGKTSPSVSTLQQLALALKVPLSAFFETAVIEKQVVFTPADDRPQVSIGSTVLESLGKELAGNAVQPFIVSLNPGMGSGNRPVVHTGHEFVYCLCGTIRYQIEDDSYVMHVGDSLVFQAHLPHCWENTEEEPARILLVFYPSDENETPDGHHFSLQTMRKEFNMKIAVITDNGKTISQHFGRAPYYLVLTIEEGKVIEREMRDKMGHSQFAAQHGEHGDHEIDHGMDASSHGKHLSMAETIADCKALICGGMGMGAYNSMRSLNIQPIVTDLVSIDEAVKAFIDGKLVDHTEFLH
jgi:transcriptional regulator with XRE-family HTH domain/predicted Fe-Mo cluster-binding NifX family protein